MADFRPNVANSSSASSSWFYFHHVYDLHHLHHQRSASYAFFNKRKYNTIQIQLLIVLYPIALCRIILYLHSIMLSNVALYYTAYSRNPFSGVLGWTVPQPGLKIDCRESKLTVVLYTDLTEVLREWFELDLYLRMYCTAYHVSLHLIPPYLILTNMSLP